MKCKYCNAEVTGDTIICPYCGNPKFKIEVQFSGRGEAKTNT